MLHCFRFAGIALVVGACSKDAPERPAENRIPTEQVDSQPSPVGLVESTIPPAVAGEAGWHYQQSSETDLDGDGQPERVVLTAQVELYRGRPAWDDGQPWQVYIESKDTSRTYVFAQRLQLGTLTMRLSRSEAGTPATIVLLVHRPDKLSIYEASYRGPGQISVVPRFERDLDPTGEIASPALP